MCKRFTAIIIVILIAITAPFTAFTEVTNTPDGIKSAVEGVISFKYEQEQANSLTELLDKLSANAGSYSSDWYYIAYSQYGLDCKNKKSIDALKSKVDEFYAGDLADVKVTDMQRVALALSACAVDITKINGHNLLADATYNRAKVKPINSQGVNSTAFALLLLNSKNYEIPADAKTTRDKMIELILKAELENGGFSLFGDYPDIDITSIAMQALAPYYSRSDVKSTLDKCVSIFSSRQDSTGGYKSFSNEIACESTAQVILALTSMGINPCMDSRFIKDGNSVFDGLMAFKLKSGAFSHFKNGKADNMATYQALCALISMYRFANGEKSFYDFSDISVSKEATTEQKFTSKPKTKNNSKSENKIKKSKKSDKAITESESTASKKSKKIKQTKQNKQITESTETETVTEAPSTAKNNSVKEIKSDNSPQNSIPLYIIFSGLFCVFIAFAVIKRRKR